jgi:serine/threonine-protein kinase
MPLSGVADLVGRVLADRYRLVAPIGAGGSGRVYVADDIRLRRRVAVKVLHAGLADDAGFLRRFRAEAQHAASLHHPNVMAVYDWGQDGVPFMVLELLTGGSLRGMLDAGNRLTPSQAAYVGRQVAAALSYAHTRGLVHRDIKPANLLFDEHAIVRVADFGLARALAEASWTEPAGTVVGTTRYGAPEQATGASLDARTDLYSLSLVLVECVTGQVPELGDSPIGTLARRGQVPVSAPTEMGALGPVIERAGRPSPDERYPDAATMGDALASAARSLPPPGPLTLVGLGAAAEDPHPTRLGRSSSLFDQDAADDETVAVRVVDAALDPPVVDDRPRTRRAGRAVPFVVAALVVGVLAAVVILLMGSTGGSAQVPAPQLVGLDADAAGAQAARAGVLLRTERVDGDDPAGLVIEQRPAAGAFLAEGGTVRIVVSKGPPPIQIPDVEGAKEQDALAVLGPFQVDIERRNDESVAAGNAIGTEPAAGQTLAPDSAITLLVSTGPAPVEIPNVTGTSFDDASAQLRAKGFSVVRSDQFSGTVDKDKVIGTDPPAGQLATRNSQVTVVVSKGQETVKVPNFRDATLEQAQQMLTQLGLIGDFQNVGANRKVRAQDPDPGTTVNKGSKVTLVFIGG